MHLNLHTSHILPGLLYLDPFRKKFSHDRSDMGDKQALPHPSTEVYDAVNSSLAVSSANHMPKANSVGSLQPKIQNVAQTALHDPSRLSRLWRLLHSNQCRTGRTTRSVSEKVSYGASHVARRNAVQ